MRDFTIRTEGNGYLFQVKDETGTVVDERMFTNVRDALLYSQGVYGQQYGFATMITDRRPPDPKIWKPS